MNIKLFATKTVPPSGDRRLFITGSKSETNRLLLLQALYPNILLENISISDDSEVMIAALQNVTLSAVEVSAYNLQPNTYRLINVHHAGTAMRFLTAFFAIQEGVEVVITGSERMKERPIKILVDALNQLGAEITYQEKEGFPPLYIKGKKLSKNQVSLSANVSSQYISALLLIAPKLENGLELILEGEIMSIPYIKMTLALLHQIGVNTSFEENTIYVSPSAVEVLQPTTHNLQPTTITIESDWSSASYYYSIIALSEIGTQLTLSNFKQNSLQGDSVLVEIYKDFGVQTVFNNDNSMTISKVLCPTERSRSANLQPITYNLKNSPDIAQTIAVTCFGLGISCHLTGLHTLKIKETDRLEALKKELTKLGAAISITDDALHLKPSTHIIENISIATYNDHRMAMAFAPLALKTSIIIEDAQVVSKSYPTFWEDLKTIGFQIKNS